MKRPLLRTGCLLVALACSLPAAAAEGATSTEQAAIERLVKNLASDSKTKQKAGEEGLVEIGQAVIPEVRKLLEHPKKEVRARAERILEKLGAPEEPVPPPGAARTEEREPTDRQQEAADLAALIRETRSPAEGAEALLALRRLGRAGLSAWVDLFPARTLAPEDLEIAPAALPRPLRPGEPFWIVMIVTNRSKGPVWISTMHALTVRASPEGPGKKIVDLGMAGVPDDMDDSVFMMSDLYDQVLLPPGGTLSRQIACKAPAGPGTYRISGRYDVTPDFAKLLEQNRARAKELLAAPEHVTFKQNDGLMRGSPDVLARDFNWGTITVRGDTDAQRE